MDGTLKITKEQAQGSVSVMVLHLRGWLDAQGEDALLAAARDVYDEGARYLLLNLAEVDTLTSAGMRAIQKAYTIFSAGGESESSRRVKLCKATPPVYHVLELTGFLQSIPNYETQQAAVDSFK
jgi:anti-anti-sigma factor